MLEVQNWAPRISPYSDAENWDLLWLGHYGAGFPRSPFDSELGAIGRYNVLADPNEPYCSNAQLPPWTSIQPLDALRETHPPHTRVYHRALDEALCTVAYAVIQWRVRNLLHEFSVEKWSHIWDVDVGVGAVVTASQKLLFLTHSRLLPLKNSSIPRSTQPNMTRKSNACYCWRCYFVKRREEKYCDS